MKTQRKRTPWFLTLLTHAGVAIAFVSPFAAASIWTGGTGL